MIGIVLYICVCMKINVYLKRSMYNVLGIELISEVLVQHINDLMEEDLSPIHAHSKVCTFTIFYVIRFLSVAVTKITSITIPW